jgi:hypothetical protein
MIVTIRMSDLVESRTIIPTAMARKLLGGAAGMVSLAADVARHLAWYVSHQVSGQARDASRDPERRQEVDR